MTTVRDVDTLTLDMRVLAHASVPPAKSGEGRPRPGVRRLCATWTAAAAPKAPGPARRSAAPAPPPQPAAPTVTVPAGQPSVRVPLVFCWVLPGSTNRGRAGSRSGGVPGPV